MKKSVLILSALIACVGMFFMGCANAAEGDSSTSSSNNSSVITPSNGGNPVSYTALPIVPCGNSLTRIDGAGIMIFLDNTDLGITGANASSIISGLGVSITDTATSSAVECTSMQFDDYNDSSTPKTVRLYLLMPNSEKTSVDVKVTGTINGTAYQGTATFVNGVYQFDYTPTSISISPATKEVKPGVAVNFVVKGTPYNLDITDDCTFTISDDATSSSITGATLTAGATNGTVTVTATYKTTEITSSSIVTVNSSALPTVMDTSKVDGAGVEVFISKDDVATTPDASDVTITGSLSSTASAWLSYVSDNLAITNITTTDQGDKTRLYFNIPNGFSNGAEITMNFVISWDGYEVNVQFDGNALTSSSIETE